MTSEDLRNAIYFLSRVSVRGFQEEEELLDLISKMRAHISRNTHSENVYTKDGTKAA